MAQTVLIFGGISDERLVSTASGQNISSCYPFSELWYINSKGQVFPVDPDEIAAHKKPFEIEFQPTQPALAESIEESVDKLKNKVVFLGLHGTEGEDGRLQELFEKNRIAYTGSDSQSSRVCFDKAKSKEILRPHGLPLAPEELLPAQNGALEKITAFRRKHEKIVIKPVASGSSFGLRILGNDDGIKEAAEMVISSGYGQFLMEKFVSGRELTCGVLQTPDGDVMALPPSEVKMDQGRSFDYAGKYLGKGSIEITPADLSEQETKAAQKLALESHRLLGCYGYTRTDMILADGKLTYLETNTLPGMTKASFFPQQLHAAGMPMPRFVGDQLVLAKRRVK